MDQEREDTGVSQHDVDQIQGEPAGSGYPEEQPGSSGDQDTGGKATRERSGSSRGAESGSSEGESGEGSQSTGNPGAAG
jgi:hypothetical protein